MPLTAQIFVSVIETREEYAVRRVFWATELYCQENVLPSEWQLVQRASVYNLRTNTEVRRAIEIAINTIEVKLQEQWLQAVS
jgi:hypothetical protein